MRVRLKPSSPPHSRARCFLVCCCASRRAGFASTSACVHVRFPCLCVGRRALGCGSPNGVVRQCWPLCRCVRGVLRLCLASPCCALLCRGEVSVGYLWAQDSLCCAVLCLCRLLILPWRVSCVQAEGRRYPLHHTRLKAACVA